MVNDYVPDRGDIVFIQFNPQSGREQAGRRPALILSPASYNKKVGLALICPITNKEKGYPFESKLPEDLEVQGVVLSDHVKSLDWKARKGASHLCKNKSYDEKIEKSIKVSATMTPEDSQRLKACLEEAAEILYRNTMPEELTNLETIDFSENLYLFYSKLFKP